MQALVIKYIGADLDISELDDPLWELADEVHIDRCWSGETAPDLRHFTASLAWSDTSLCVRFRASLREPLVVNDAPHVDRKTIGLWERDVCEIFIAPDASLRTRYYEFEVAPTGEWLDLAIESSSLKRTTNWDYASGMATAARIESGKIVMAMRIPWSAFNARPRSGDVWAGNIFRCVGKGSNRGYLAWQPTFTDTPNFHVPEKFGVFHFTDQN